MAGCIAGCRLVSTQDSEMKMYLCADHGVLIGVRVARVLLLLDMCCTMEQQRRVQTMRTCFEILV